MVCADQQYATCTPLEKNPNQKGCMQMQRLLQGGIQKLEQQPDHEEDVPIKADLLGLIDKAQKLLQLKEAGNRCAHMLTMC